MQTKETKKLLYWESLIGDDQALAPYYESIQKLLNGQYRAVYLEKLSGHNIYSIRVNKNKENSATRLLFTTIQYEGAQHLVFLEVIKNHDYHHSKFLKTPQLLKDYCQWTETQLNELKKEFVLVENEEEGLQFLEKKGGNDKQEFTAQFKAQAVERYNQQFIFLSDEQENAKLHPLPLLISGGPGSGKSCVALLLLKQILTGKALYIAQSKALINKMSLIWQSLPESQIEGYEVVFKTYQDLLLDYGLIEANPQYDWVGEKTFLEWFKVHASKYQLKSFDPHLIYQEFRIISGYEKNDYLNLGLRNSLFTQKQDRLSLMKAYKGYQISLEKHFKIDVSFKIVILDHFKTKFNRIVVDEAQDFSRLQLKQIFTLVENRAIAFCLDTLQSLADTKSIRPFLEDLCHDTFNEKTKSVHTIELSASYRCPKAIIDLANDWLDLKLRVTGGIGDKREHPKLCLSDGQKQHPGMVQWLDKKNDTQCMRDWVELAKTPQFAIITSAACKKEAKNRFKTPLVFTPEKIKGLEYDYILLYKLFDDEKNKLTYKKIQEILKNTSNKGNTNRPKTQDIHHESHAPFFNQIFVAITRAMQRLYIYQDITHNLEFLNQLKKHASKIEKQASYEPKINQNHTSEWEKEFQRQLENRNFSQAREIYTKKLQGSAEDFDKKYSDSDDKNKEKPINNLSKYQKKTSYDNPILPLSKNPKKFSHKTRQNNNNNNNNNNNTKKNILPLFSLNNVKQVVSDIKNDLFNQNDPKPIVINCLTPYFDLPAIFFEELPIESIQDTGFLLTDLLSRPNYQSVLKETFKDILLEKLHQYQHLLCQPHSIHKMSILYWLATKNLDVLYDLFARYPKIAASITANAVCAIHAKNQDSALYGLVINHKGRDILALLLKQNPILKNMTANALCTIYPNHQASAFYWLACNGNKGRDLLALLLQQSTILEGMTAQALCTFQPKHQMSAFYSLADKEDGQEILALLLKQNSVLKGITAEVLCTIYPKDNDSILFWLASEEDKGLELLALLLNQPAILQGITEQALCAMHGTHHISVLFCLAANPKGRELLILLLKQTSIFKENSAKALCALHPERNDSALYWLTCGGARSLEILALLLNQPDILEGITANALCAIHPEHHDSALYWLTHGRDKGLEILSLLLKKSSNILENMTPEALNAIHTLEKVPPLYWLAAGGEKILELLMQLLKKTPILSGITAEALCAIHPIHQVSALYWLLATRINTGQKIFWHIIKFRPNFLQDIPAEAFFQSYIDYNTPAFYWLCEGVLYGGNSRLTLLAWLLETHPTLLKKLSTDLLLQTHKKNQSHALFHLTQTPKGIEILCALLNNNTEVAQGVAHYLKTFSHALNSSNQFDLYQKVRKNLIKHQLLLKDKLKQDIYEKTLPKIIKQNSTIKYFEQDYDVIISFGLFSDSFKQRESLEKVKPAKSARCCLL